MIIKSILSAAALAALVATTPMAFAKGHDQGGTANPGDNVQSETVGPAQSLGGPLGNGGNSSGNRQDGNAPQ